MTDQLLFIVRLGLLAIVYLTFFRVLRVVWVELRTENRIVVPTPGVVPVTKCITQLLELRTERSGERAQQRRDGDEEVYHEQTRRHRRAVVGGAACASRAAWPRHRVWREQRRSS